MQITDHRKSPVWALGAMSGTSLDGVDAAMLLSDGTEIEAFGTHSYRPYSDQERIILRNALGKWPSEAGVDAAVRVVESAHFELLSSFQDVKLIGFHGQTLAHDPIGRGATHQAGDGHALAQRLARPVVWDFRSADIIYGGHGAPLAPFFHFACAKWAKETQPFAFLNLGGVGNLTWVDPSYPIPEAEGALMAFDTGPANAPLDDFMLAHYGMPHDEGGELAASGMVNREIVTEFLKHPYFVSKPPKSLDRNEFQNIYSQVKTLSCPDAMATLTECVAAAVSAALSHLPKPIEKILVCGGGRKNLSLMMALRRRVAFHYGRAFFCVEPVETIGLNGDMLEAQAFAYLSVRVLHRLPLSSPQTTGACSFVSGGRISWPE